MTVKVKTIIKQSIFVIWLKGIWCLFIKKEKKRLKTEAVVKEVNGNFNI